MKKLLLVLLALPMLFTTCKKENEINNTENNLSTALGNFLEKYNGSVWEYSSGVDNLWLSQIGFYNADYFFIQKDSTDCRKFTFGLNINTSGEESNIITTQHNHLWPFTIIETLNGQSIQTQFEVILSNDTSYNDSMKITRENMIGYYIESTDTNLSCQ